MRVTYETQHKETEIGIADTIEKCFKIITAYCKKIKFKPNYIRYWLVAPNKYKVDYGSYVNFFYIENTEGEFDV